MDLGGEEIGGTSAWRRREGFGRARGAQVGKCRGMRVRVPNQKGGDRLSKRIGPDRSSASCDLVSCN